MTDDGNGKATLARKATWIKKDLTLRQVLKDARALKSFQDFAKTLHADENVSFWVAVEFFRVQHVSTPRASGRVRKRLSEQLTGLQMEGEENRKAAEEEGGYGTVFGKTVPRHSILMKDIITPDRLSQMSVSEQQKLLIRDASRIFSLFLEDGAPVWTCVDASIVDKIRAALKGNGEGVDISIFSEAQHQIYNTLNTDVFPRFLKAVMAEPDKYSTGERFELPEEIAASGGGEGELRRVGSKLLVAINEDE